MKISIDDISILLKRDASKASEITVPRLYDAIRRYHPDYVVKDLELAKMDILLALIVLECISCKNLYSSEVSERLIKRLILTFPEEERKVISNKITLFSSLAKESIEAASKNPDHIPLFEVLVLHLLKQWGGESVYSIRIDEHGPLHPVTVFLFSEILRTTVGFMKNFKDKHGIIDTEKNDDDSEW